MCEVCDKQGSVETTHAPQAFSADVQIVALLTEIRDRLTPPPQPMNNEQAALNIVRAVGKDLQDAAQALAIGAKRLQNKGDVYGAGELMKAAKRAAGAAESLIGG